MFGRLPQWSCLVLDFSLQGVFVLFCFVFTDSILLLVISLFKLSVSSCLKFGRLCISRNFSISCRLSSLLAYNSSYFYAFFFYSLMTFCISAVSVVTSPLSLLILFIWVLSLFFLVSLARGFQFYLCEKPAVGFIDLFYCFLISILFISSLIFISFLVLTIGFVYSSSSNSFRW